MQGVPTPARAHRPGRWLPPLTVAVGLLPLAKLAVDGAIGRLGANPIAEGLNRLGFWTLTFLALSLVPTPARELLGVKWPLRVRRTLGLLAFSYGALHFAWYLGVDKFFDLGDVTKDIAKRKFITVGFAALLVLAPLAVTSTDRWVRRLGFARWKRLHRLAYLAAVLGAVHFAWRVKADYRKPALFATAVGLLLAVRVALALVRRARTGGEARAPPPREIARTRMGQERQLPR
jgi:sulfoxide reductase heme-binding subunit YedZ